MGNSMRNRRRKSEGLLDPLQSTVDTAVPSNSCTCSESSTHDSCPRASQSDHQLLPLTELTAAQSTPQHPIKDTPNEELIDHFLSNGFTDKVESKAKDCQDNRIWPRLFQHGIDKPLWGIFNLSSYPKSGSASSHSLSDQVSQESEHLLADVDCDVNNSADENIDLTDIRCQPAGMAVSAAQPRELESEVRSCEARSTARTSNRKRRRGVKYLSPLIERKASQWCAASAELNHQAAASDDDILTEYELSLRHRQAENKKVQTAAVEMGKVSEDETRQSQLQTKIRDFWKSLGMATCPESKCREHQKAECKSDSNMPAEADEDTIVEVIRSALEKVGLSAELDPDEDIIDGEEALAAWIESGGQGELIPDADLASNKPLTLAQCFKLQRVFEHLRSLCSKEAEPIGDSVYSDTDLTLLENEISTLSGRMQISKELCDASQDHSPAHQGHGDSLLNSPDVPLDSIRVKATERSPLSLVSHKHRSRHTFSKTNPTYSEAASSPAGNTNVSMSSSAGDQEKKKQSQPLHCHMPGSPCKRSSSLPNLQGDSESDKLKKTLSADDICQACQCTLDVSFRSEPPGKVPSLLWGQEGYRHYQMLTMVEQEQKILLLRSAKASIVHHYIEKQKTLRTLVEAAKAYYSEPTFKNRENWRALQDQIPLFKTQTQADLRHTLAQIPCFTPWFTYFIMTMEVLALVVMCGLGSIASVGISSTKQTRNDVATWLGAETVTKTVLPNMWIGPPFSTLLASGAAYAPCMRRDHAIQLRLTKIYSQNRNTASNSSLGCCVMGEPISAAGTTTQKECQRFTHGAGKLYSKNCTGESKTIAKVKHRIRPCCIGYEGDCRMLSSQECLFQEGFFQKDTEHCTQVLCLREVCHMGSGLFLLKPDSRRPYLAGPGTRWQWWRFLLAVPYTFGWLHLVPLLLIQWLLMRPLECNSGWLRTLLVYTLSSVLGQIMTAVVEPFNLLVGSTSGVSSMLGQASMELVEVWALLNKPLRQLYRLVWCLAALCLLGLLPNVSIMGALTGLLSGFASSLVFMRYVTYDNRGLKNRLILMSVGLVSMLGLYVALLYVFLNVQPPPCTICNHIDCVTFTDTCQGLHRL